MRDGLSALSDPSDPSGTAADPAAVGSLSAYFHAVTIRADESTLSTRLDLREELLDDGGALRAGAVTYAVDVATGIASGTAVLDRNMWVVTTDLDVHLTVPVTVGPLRVDVDLLRAGATTAVTAFSLHDEGAGRPVGGGTATGRPFPFEFDRSVLEIPISQEFRAPDDRGGTIGGAPIATRLGFRVGEGGSVEVDLEAWLRNPWGILHGGVTACLIDIAGEAAGSAAFGRGARVTSEMVRYLAPAKAGPVRAVPRVLAVDDRVAPRRGAGCRRGC